MSESREIVENLSRDGQLLLPYLDMSCNTEQAVGVSRKKPRR